MPRADRTALLLTSMGKVPGGMAPVIMVRGAYGMEGPGIGISEQEQVLSRAGRGCRQFIRTIRRQTSGRELDER